MLCVSFISPSVDVVSEWKCCSSPLRVEKNALAFVFESSLKLNSYSNAFFYHFVACAFLFFEVKSVLPIDRYQNTTSKAISQHELKKVQLQERYTLVTQDSIGHLKTLCMTVLSLVVALESEWKRYSSSQSDKKNARVRVWIQLNALYTGYNWTFSSLFQYTCSLGCHHFSKLYTFMPSLDTDVSLVLIILGILTEC